MFRALVCASSAVAVAGNSGYSDYADYSRYAGKSAHDSSGDASDYHQYMDKYAGGVFAGHGMDKYAHDMQKDEDRYAGKFEQMDKDMDEYAEDVKKHADDYADKYEHEKDKAMDRYAKKWEHAMGDAAGAGSDSHSSERATESSHASAHASPHESAQESSLSGAANLLADSDSAADAAHWQSDAESKAPFDYTKMRHFNYSRFQASGHADGSADWRSDSESNAPFDYSKMEHFDYSQYKDVASKHQRAESKFQDEAFEHHLVHSEKAANQNLPDSVADCHTMSCLDAWRDAQHSQAKVFGDLAPTDATRAWHKSIDEQYDTNKERIRAEERQAQAKAQDQQQRADAKATETADTSADDAPASLLAADDSSSDPAVHFDYSGFEKRKFEQELAERVRLANEAPGSPADCRSVGCLDEWRASQASQLKRYGEHAPQIARDKWQESIDEQYKTNKARIGRERQVAEDTAKAAAEAKAEADVRQAPKVETEAKAEAEPAGGEKAKAAPMEARASMDAAAQASKGQALDVSLWSKHSDSAKPKKGSRVVHSGRADDRAREHSEREAHERRESRERERRERHSESLLELGGESSNLHALVAAVGLAAVAVGLAVRRFWPSSAEEEEQVEAYMPLA